MTNHETFMRRAIQLSIENVTLRNGGPFGCVVVKDNEIIAEGYNKVSANNDPTAHAEVTAIRVACEKLGTFQLDNCIIYTSCEPCPMCLGAIYWARPKAVYYANTKKDAADILFDDDFIYQEIAVGINNRKLPFKQILKEEALEAFKAWSNKVDKVEY
jgi:tRNA(Arg) A34 adenosine deaminase TadA